MRPTTPFKEQLLLNSHYCSGTTNHITLLKRRDDGRKHSCHCELSLSKWDRPITLRFAAAKAKRGERTAVTELLPCWDNQPHHPFTAISDDGQKHSCHCELSLSKWDQLITLRFAAKAKRGERTAFAPRSSLLGQPTTSRFCSKTRRGGVNLLLGQQPHHP